MDLSKLKPGAFYQTSQVFIANPVPGRPIGYQTCRIKIEDGWCYIELNEKDGEGSVDVYPASQIAGIVNLYEPTDGPPHDSDARMSGEHLIPRRPTPEVTPRTLGG
jgi:hypothetical protein